MKQYISKIHILSLRTKSSLHHSLHNIYTATILRNVHYHNRHVPASNPPSTSMSGRNEASGPQSGGGASVGADGMAAGVPTMEPVHAGGETALQQRRRARTHQSQVRASTPLWLLERVNLLG